VRPLVLELKQFGLRIWCAPDVFAKSEAHGAAFMRASRDEGVPESLVAIDETYRFHGAITRKIVLATRGARPSEPSVLAVLERARVLLIEGDEFIDQAFGRW